jgi:flagellar hook assembly protein FlgD
VSIDIYNSAGELVRSLYYGRSENPLTQLQVQVSGPTGNGAPVWVDIAGLGIPGGDPTWNGANQGGQWVTSGVYYVKVSSTDPFGNVTTHTESVNVLGVENQETVEIFNSAGEVVRNFSLSGLSSTAQDLSVALAQGQGAVVATTNPVTGAVTGGVNITLTMTNGGNQSLFWDGLGSGGQDLQSGTYLIELVRTETGQSSTVKTVAVSLLESKDSSADNVASSAIAGPDPVIKGLPVRVRYKPNSQDWVQAKLYNEGGELVGEATDFGTGFLSFNSGLSGGIYLIDFEVRRDEAILARRIMKVAVVR